MSLAFLFARIFDNADVVLEGRWISCFKTTIAFITITFFYPLMQRLSAKHAFDLILFVLLFEFELVTSYSQLPD